jgi:Nucleoside-diphosphate-sugar epimerases
MNIIITGALGHIGSNFLVNSHKLKKVKKIFAIDRIDEKILTLINLKLKRKIFFINLDLSKKKINLKHLHIDTVVHLASTTNAAASIKNKKDVYKNNLSCFYNVINFCNKTKANLIHISSTSVYGSQKLYVDEECKELKPQSPYADVKLLEEKFLKKKILNLNMFL